MFDSIASLQAVSAPQGNVDDEIYRSFRSRTSARFERAASSPLFTTDADLWPIYMAAFPEATRQYHNCSACRRFLRAFGGLAVIGEHGEVKSAMWDATDADDDHRAAVVEMRAAVCRAKITGVFLSSSAALGEEITGTWAHLAVRLPAGSPAIWPTASLLTAGQKMAERRVDHATVMRALAEYPLELLSQVVELLDADALYRAEKVLGPAHWLRDLAAAAAGSNRTNVAWRAIATAPAGFCHPRSSMIGTLLDDIAGGMSFEVAAKRFADKMHPLQYQRPQAAPSTGQIAAAERLVAKLDIATALPRRFARLEEIETLWRPKKIEEPQRAGVFGHLAPGAAKGKTIETFEQKITWVRFVRDVLPGAIAIDVLVPITRANFCAMVTAQDPTAPPILQWDAVERRNPVSWYVYQGGSSASQWGLTPGWAAVEALALQPSMWGGRELEHQGKSAIAVIGGARDGNWIRAGGGLFPEILRSELRAARAVIEAYSRTARIDGYAESSACGLRLPGVTLRVTTATGSRFVYAIDRWD